MTHAPTITQQTAPHIIWKLLNPGQTGGGVVAKDSWIGLLVWWRLTHDGGRGDTMNLSSEESFTKEHICPYGDCVYELPIWRNTLRRLFTRHCHIDDLKVWKPQLGEELQQKRYVYRNGVKYKLNKHGNHIHMIPAKLCQDSRPESDSITEPNTEKSKSRILGKLKNQRRLDEATEKTKE